MEQTELIQKMRTDLTKLVTDFNVEKHTVEYTAMQARAIESIAVALKALERYEPAMIVEVPNANSKKSK